MESVEVWVPPPDCCCFRLFCTKKGVGACLVSPDHAAAVHGALARWPVCRTRPPVSLPAVYVLWGVEMVFGLRPFVMNNAASSLV